MPVVALVMSCSIAIAPQNGKEEDFQLFMALLDGDRFEDRFRDGVHVCDTSDLMRLEVEAAIALVGGMMK